MYIYPNNPERYAQDIILELDLKPPVDVIKICNAYGLILNTENIKFVDALLIISKEKKNIILSNEILYLTRRRFSIAHEIGHYFIPWHKNNYSCSEIGLFSSFDKDEREADTFAAELLIPTRIIKKEIENRNISLDLIKEFSNKYDVSLIAMARKLLSITPEKAIVFLYYNKGNKIILSSSISFNYEIHEGIIEGSAAEELIHRKNKNETIKKILDSFMWIKESNNQFKIMEESFYQPTFDRVFTMLRIANETDYFNEF